MMKADAVIVAAGKGHRFMKGEKKQFTLLGGKSILAHTLDKFEASPLVRYVFLVVGHEDMDYCLKEIIEKYHYHKPSLIIPGGKRRQDSVKNGMDALPKDTEIVVIHDGVRPFVTKEMIEESIRSAMRYQAVVFGTPVKETIKMVHTDGTVIKTLERESIWQIQTPQTFKVKVIKEAYAKAQEEGFVGTDDASFVERVGVKVHVLPGPYTNIKITTPEDLVLANLYLGGKIPSRWRINESGYRI